MISEVLLKSIEGTSSEHLFGGPDISGGENIKLQGISPFGPAKKDGLESSPFRGLHEGMFRAENVAVEADCKSLLAQSCMVDPVSVVQDIFSEPY